MSEHIEIEVLKAEGATRDCTVGKIYKALRTTPGMVLQGGIPIQKEGATFFDDVGEQCEVMFSSGRIKLVE